MDIKGMKLHKANLIIINLMEKNKLRNTVWHECGHKTGHFIGPYLAIWLNMVKLWTSDLIQQDYELKVLKEYSGMPYYVCKK